MNTKKNAEWLSFCKIIDHSNDLLFSGKISFDEHNEMWDAAASSFGLSDNEIVDFISDEFSAIHADAMAVPATAEKIKN